MIKKAQLDAANILWFSQSDTSVGSMTTQHEWSMEKNTLFVETHKHF